MASSLHESKQKILGKIVGLVYLMQDEMTTTTTRYSHIYYSLKKKASLSSIDTEPERWLYLTLLSYIYKQRPRLLRA